MSRLLLKGGTTVAPVTWNPSAKGTNITLSGGNLTEAGGVGLVRATASVAPGTKVYWELLIVSGGDPLIGIDDGSSNVNNYLGATGSFGWGWYFPFSLIFHNGGTVGTSVGATVGNVISFAIDHVAHTMTIYKDGVAITPVTTILSATSYYPCASSASASGKITARFSSASFSNPLLIWTTLSAAGYTPL